MFDVSQEEITEGSLVRALLLLAAPLIVQKLVHLVNQIVDTIWVGRIGEGAAAAVGLSIPVLAVFFAVMASLRVGTQVLVSQRTGNDRPAAARRATVNGILLGVAVGLLLTAMLRASAPWIVGLLDVDPTVAPLAVTYFTTVALLYPLEGASNAIEAGFVGWGDSKASMYSNVVFVVTNLVLDPVLIFGLGPAPALGLRGAALAMVSGSAAGLVLAAAFAVRGRAGFRLAGEALAFDRGDHRETLDIAAPRIGQGIGRQSAGVAVIAVVSAVSDAAGLVAFLIGTRMAAVAFVPVQGLSEAAQSVIGQNLGAERPDRAWRTTWAGVVIAMTALLALAVGQWVVPTAITTLFVPDISVKGLDLAVDYLRILAFSYPAIGATYVFTAGFDGARLTQVSMVVRLLQYWAVRVPIAAVGGILLGIGIHAVFWGVAISNIAAALGVGAYYYHRTSRGMLDRAAERAVASD